MQSHNWTLLLVAAAACATATLAARPYPVNHTEVRRTHPLRNSVSRAPGTRRRARQTFFVTPPSLSGPYWKNDSLAGVEVSCDDNGKACLAIGRLFHESSGRCYPIGDSRPCNDTRFSWVLNGDALRQGRLSGICRRKDPCVGFVMAYDGICHNATHIYRKLCHPRASLALHPTGKWECVCPKSLCPKREPLARQSSTRGSCVLPVFRESEMEFNVACTMEQARCLRVQKLPFRGNCESPLTPTVCPNGQWLTLDAKATVEGHLRVGCTSKQPCGARSRLLRADGRCHTEQELNNTLCPNDMLLYIPTGESICVAENANIVLNSEGMGGKCQVSFLQETWDSNVMRGGIMECGYDNKGNCGPQVTGTLPPAVFIAEDE